VQSVQKDLDPLHIAIDAALHRDETPLVLVRHGRTRANAEQRFVGAMDIPLDELGLAQAGRVCSRLAALEREALYASPLSRAMQTAAPLGEPIQVPELAELNQGAFEGRPAAEVIPEHPEIFAAWATDPTDVRVPGGETLRELSQRVLPALLDLGRRHTGPVLVFTHQMVLAVTVLSTLGLPFRFLRHVRQPNTAVSVFGVRDEGLYLHRLNDHSHATVD